MTVRVLAGHVLDRLATLPERSVHCCVTSVPYYGLRSYGTEPQVWGGDPEHGHEWGSCVAGDPRGGSGTPTTKNNRGEGYGRDALRGCFCLCGAWRGELGLEPDPLLYVAHIVEVFRAVWRVLRDDGTLWLNIGDSYAGSGKGRHDYREVNKNRSLSLNPDKYADVPAAPRGFKAKDLYLIPERIGLALCDDGWYVRSRIAWCKTSCMPESVQDRPTNAWEHIWLLSKEQRYFYDADAVRVAAATDDPQSASYRANGKSERRVNPVEVPPGATLHTGLDRRGGDGTGANLRNIWLLGPEPLKEAHYAAYPTEIPRRAILAGTSKKGVCPACGAPWVRCREKKPYGSWHDHTENLTVGAGQGAAERNKRYRDEWEPAKTLGWRPSCACDAGEPIPATVLDPFLGSGTTALVADRLGRDAIGVELQPKYVQIAERRVRADAPLFAEIA